MIDISKRLTEAFQRFLALDSTAYFNDDFRWMYRDCLHEAECTIENSEVVSRCAIDLCEIGLSQSVESFCNRLQTWQILIGSQRSEWLYNNFEIKLPSNVSLREIFGTACDEIENIRAQARRIIRDLTKGQNGHQNDQIPSEHRSKPISKNKAAKLLGQNGDENRAVEWLNRCVLDGTISCMKMSRQSYCFDMREFPQDKRSKLMP
ncbi:MAG TPA: hypothetical protein VM260_10205 [Pirellula sp.]|nr:hypothetical protein [Pirellula sp.]